MVKFNTQTNISSEAKAKTGSTRHKKVTPPKNDNPLGGKNAIRIDAHLIAEATEASTIAHRSVPKQIEYWAKVGQILSKELSEDQTHGLFADQFIVESIDLKLNQSLDVGDVLADIESERSSGSLTAGITRASEVFDLDSGRPGLIRCTSADGTQAFGTFVNGQFSPTSMEGS